MKFEKAFTNDTTKLLPFEPFQSHPKLESLCWILCLKFGPVYVIKKERFYKNIKILKKYQGFEVCSGISR